MKYAVLTLIGVTCWGCGSAGETKPTGDAAAPATSATSARIRSTSSDSTRTEQPALAEGEVRVPLFVLPGDAPVEVDNVLVRRRNGTVELVGKIGDEFRVRVYSGPRTEEKIVKIEATGTSPASIEVNTASLPR